MAGESGRAKGVRMVAFRLHIKNNRAGEAVFRTTSAQYDAAAARHAQVASQVKPIIDWDLDNFDSSIEKAHGLVTYDLPTSDLALRAPDLKWIHIIGAGVEHLMPLDWLPPGVALTNSRGVHAQKAGEYAAMALLMLNAGLPKLAADQRARRWDPVFTPSIAGKTCLIVGVGQMGAAAARQAKALGLHVIGVRRHGRKSRFVDEMVGPNDLDRVLPLADFVIVTTPLTAETRGLIDDGRLGRMKAGAGLINIGRAAVVDYAALSARLRDGHLSGGVLDVFDPEPLPAGSPLWDTPNLIITPHVSSDDADGYVQGVLDIVFDNIGRTLAGRPLRNRVNHRLGY